MLSHLFKVSWLNDNEQRGGAVDLLTAHVNEYYLAILNMLANEEKEYVYIKCNAAYKVG